MYRETRGNNVHAQADPEGIGWKKWEQLPRPQANADMGFDFPIDLSLEPSNYSDAAVTNLFYWCNMMHDILYQYGFNEVAGNLQDDNFNRGGKDNDALVALAQYGDETDNSLIFVGRDGKRPNMRMFLWDYTTPMRDGDLSNDIIIHEYTHALSVRLTGGPSNGACLGYGEPGGMGEGWSDFVAMLITTKENRTAKDSVTIAGYVMEGGTIWGTILFEVYWAFVSKYGYTADFYSASETHGNTLILKLVILGMKLQPCQPSFKDARDAIILADRLLTGSKNLCLLWGAFARRGLGIDTNATETGYKNGFGVPNECNIG
ncbi:hypothetical protein IWQ62_004907 [Dispira parvispora]|uniref:Extracellular metalloproteinase n=1 Tax=Dispira parvispora TaxID=1520584 RepID=A0A9W8E1J3_9FUNG|nr:hypothetical protein IWQ62_004907 [Dispira parvispora]